MKKWLLLYCFIIQHAVIYAQSNYEVAQTTSNHIFYGSTQNKKGYKKKSFIDEIDLTAKISAHKYHLFSTQYTANQLSDGFPDAEAEPNIFLHYKIISPLEINYDFTGKIYFLNKHVFIETGLEWQYSYTGAIKVSSSHIANNSWLYRMYPGYDTSKYSSVQKSESVWNEIYIPVFVGVQYKFLSLSIGTYRNLYYWYKDQESPDIGYNDSSHGLYTNDGFTRDLNPVVNLSATVINKKFKLSPFLSYRFSELYAGAELALVLKKNE